jgi:hypothetical protein
MITTAPNQAPPLEDTATLDHIENPQPVLHDAASGKAVRAVGDYSGFEQKTDPKEIKLVRKLDMYIMVSILLQSDLISQSFPLSGLSSSCHCLC